MTVYHVFAPSTGVYPDKPGPIRFPSGAGGVLRDPPDRIRRRLGRWGLAVSSPIDCPSSEESRTRGRRLQWTEVVKVVHYRIDTTNLVEEWLVENVA